MSHPVSPKLMGLYEAAMAFTESPALTAFLMDLVSVPAQGIATLAQLHTTALAALPLADKEIVCNNPALFGEAISCYLSRLGRPVTIFLIPNTTLDTNADPSRPAIGFDFRVYANAVSGVVASHHRLFLNEETIRLESMVLLDKRVLLHYTAQHNRNTGDAYTSTVSFDAEYPQWPMKMTHTNYKYQGILAGKVVSLHKPVVAMIDERSYRLDKATGELAKYKNFHTVIGNPTAMTVCESAYLASKDVDALCSDELRTPFHIHLWLYAADDLAALPLPIFH